ncbi:MAG: Hsp20/alpha crystallin family protein [Chitinophagaceae bacterium]|nr:Hsp20/alpha crystallin family protein [Chitinophagaceae bacterium]
MVALDSHNEKCSVYPGEFIPRLKMEDIAGEMNREHKVPIPAPRVNVSELTECFKIEVEVPGVNRDDFYISADKNFLSVTVFHKGYPETEQGNFQLHEFDCNCSYRHILLPENADAGFAVAEYKAGVLYVYIPKTDHPLKQAPARIVVY